jgi:UDP-glucose 4-epimerase
MKSSKNTIIVTGGAGFVGSNLILLLLKKTKLKIISLDNYSSGKKINHIKNNRVRYINGHTKNIASIAKNKKNKIKTIFHFGEFSRIYQSFLNMNECIESNSVGTNAVFNFCLKHDIKLIYSATSASLGNKGRDKNLSPYAFTKSKNLEMLENLKKWFKMKYEVIYFYNVYGPGQIESGPMSTVIGIFENYYKKKKPLPIVKPGTQSRRFTHINDTINICYLAWKRNLCRHYSISNKKSYSINQVAKLFKSKLYYLPPRKGERYASALTRFSQSNKIYSYYGSLKLSDYVSDFLKKYNNETRFR